MRGGAAVTHQPRPPQADALRYRSTHPTKLVAADAAFVGFLVCWFSGCSRCRCRPEGSEAKMASRAGTRRMREGAAVTHQPCPPGADALRCRSTHPTRLVAAGAAFVGFSVCWFSGCSRCRCRPEGSEAKMASRAGTRRMRGGEAVTHQPRPAGADALRYRSTHPTKPCRKWRLRLLPHQPAPRTRATKKPKNQQTNKPTNQLTPQRYNQKSTIRSPQSSAIQPAAAR